MAKPTFKRGPASQHERSDQKIMEFFGPRGCGGLISITDMEGKTVVDLYRLDKCVEVRSPKENTRTISSR